MFTKVNFFSKVHILLSRVFYQGKGITEMSVFESECFLIECFTKVSVLLSVFFCVFFTKLSCFFYQGGCFTKVTMLPK